MIALLRRYWNDLVSMDGGLSLVMMNGLLAIPLLFAAFLLSLTGACISRGSCRRQPWRIRGLRHLAEEAPHPPLITRQRAELRRE